MEFNRKPWSFEEPPWTKTYILLLCREDPLTVAASSTGGVRTDASDPDRARWLYVVRYGRLFFRAIFSARFSAFDLRGFFLTFFFLSCPFAMREESISMRPPSPQKLFERLDSIPEGLPAPGPNAPDEATLHPEESPTSPPGIKVSNPSSYFVILVPGWDIIEVCICQPHRRESDPSRRS
jgi:hypothetical protein